MAHDKFRVSCKAILFNPEKTKVLVACYDKADKQYGLVGGHMEEGEQPDQAIRRELREEIGVTSVELRQFAFGMVNKTSDHKLGLVYVGVLSEDAVVTVDYNELSGALWADIADIVDDTVPLRDYKQFVLKAIG